MCRLKRCTYLSQEDKKRRACYAFQEGCLRVARDLWEGPWLTGSRRWILVWPLTEHSLIPPSQAVKQRSCESRLYRQCCQKKKKKSRETKKKAGWTHCCIFLQCHWIKLLIMNQKSNFSVINANDQPVRHLVNLHFIVNCFLILIELRKQNY